ncbi:AAA family ATPase [Nocardia sp. NPDC004068]|uniref:helix-turn-helix transcriptional regulator n=1 Tax=Nocardia sp. NPDC004068 TaxID=3364303 RepID=UPI0036A7FEC5
MRKPGSGGLEPARKIVGRVRELDEIRRLLTDDNIGLLTLVGPGGVGKTRLALEAVRRLHEEHGDGVTVHWVRLARVPRNASAETVEQEVAQAVIANDFSGRDARDALVDALASPAYEEGPQRRVLVLDNCEHILGSVGHVVDDLLTALPSLTILATSREPLGWVEEYLVNVRQLPLGDAIALFRDFARQRGIAVPTDDEATVARICRRMDLHPLWIRIAAAQLTYQSLDMISAGLTGGPDDRRLGWQSGTRVGSEVRHRGVHHAVAWSYDGLTEPERRLFENLSVFSAGYDTSTDEPGADEVGADLDAIRAICGDPDLPDIETLLHALVEKTLVTRHDTTTAVRYSLLETLRLAARSFLRQRDPDAERRLAVAHLHYYRDQLAETAAHFFGPREDESLAWARAAWDQIRCAIDTAASVPGEADAGLEICVSLIKMRVPFVRGSLRDIRLWTTRCIDASWGVRKPLTPTQIIAKSAISWLTLRQGQSAEGIELLEECVAACLADSRQMALWRERPDLDLGLPAITDLATGTALFMARRDPRAIAVLDRAVARFRAAGESSSEVMAGLFAALAAALLGSAEHACRLSTQCLDTARRSGATWAQSWAELGYAVAVMRHRDPAEAETVLRHSLTRQIEVRDQWGAAWSIELLIWAKAYAISRRRVDGRPTDTALEIAHLAGGVKKLRADLGISIEDMGSFADAALHARDVARKAIGPDTYAAAEARGQQLRPDLGEVHQLAMGTLTLDTDITSVSKSHWSRLTASEEEIALLAAAKWKNGEIADRRRSSERTVASQVLAITKKLGITSRDRIIHYVPEEKLPEVRALETHNPSGKPTNTFNR